MRVFSPPLGSFILGSVLLLTISGLGCPAGGEGEGSNCWRHTHNGVHVTF